MKNRTFTFIAPDTKFWSLQRNVSRDQAHSQNKNDLYRKHQLPNYNTARAAEYFQKSSKSLTYSRNSSPVTEPKCLLCSEQPPGPLSGKDKSTPHFYFNGILPSNPRPSESSSSFRLTNQNFSFPACATWSTHLILLHLNILTTFCE